MTRDIPTLITQLKTHLVALGDVRDCRTENEQVMLRRNYDSVQRVISGLMNEPQELERHQAALDQWQAESLASLAKQSEIEQAIADAPDYTIIADARKRDHEQNRQLHLQRQRQLLREGALYRSPGITFGSLDYIDERIAALTQQRDRVQSALNEHLRQAEQVLGEAVTK